MIQTCFFYSPSQRQSYVFPRVCPDLKEPLDWKTYNQSRFNSLPVDTIYTGYSVDEVTIAEAVEIYTQLGAKSLRIRMQ